MSTGPLSENLPDPTTCDDAKKLNFLNTVLTSFMSCKHDMYEKYAQLTTKQNPSLIL